MSRENRFVLRVPLDASRVRGFASSLTVKALAWSQQDATQQKLVRLDAEGRGTAIFEFEERPQETLRVALGPENATPFELRRLQTLSINVPAAVWGDAKEAVVPVVPISAWYAWWWQHWKQTFRVTGRVIHPGGVPVAGATVSAFDIDAWWWWTAQEQVAEAVTDDDGAFALEFTRGSGWSAWWWWATREWMSNVELVGRITAFVGQYPRYGSLPAPTNAPSLEVFGALLASSARPMPRRFQAGWDKPGTSNGTIDPGAFESLRERLVEILPRNFPLPVWPWAAWTPWEDCGANLIFRVMDRCGDESTVLLNEGVGETRWEIPSLLDVTLTARDVRPREKGAEWTLVDYLFPEAPDAVLARSA